MKDWRRIMEQDKFKNYSYDHSYDQGIYDENPGRTADSRGAMLDGFGPATEMVGQVQDALRQEVVSKSFLYMMAALGVTAVAAFAAPSVMAQWLMRNSYNFILLFVAELVIVIVSNIAVARNNVPLTAILFTLYSYITGSLLGIIFWAYDLTSVGSVFLMTALTFGIMAVYGMITKRDLTSVGNICLMGLIGIIIASLVNAFIIRNGMFDFVVSIIGLLIFVALTAYDVQKIKRRVAYSNGENVQVMALSGAFELYLDFINIFLRLLRLFGKRK